MATDRNGMDTQSDRINCCEFLWCSIKPGDELTIFFHVGGQLIGRGIIGTHLRLACDDDDITARAFPIKIEGYPGVLLQMCQTFGVSPAINEDRRRGCIPQEPDRGWLWHALRVN